MGDVLFLGLNIISCADDFIFTDELLRIKGKSMSMPLTPETNIAAVRQINFIF